MKRVLIFLSIVIFCQNSFGQKGSLFKGMYVQWGYNTEWYTRSNVHVDMSNGNHFILHKAKAVDKPDMDAILMEPLEISIPQYNYRFGFYLNKSFTKAVELNFDHIKYVIKDGTPVHITGTIDGKQVNGDSIINPYTFMHMEHTDGGNLLHINYVGKHLFLKNKNQNPRLQFIYKMGAGINIPRTDFTWRGDRYNNDFHIAGYNVSVEGGLRFYPAKKLFIEGTGKTGYVRYINALANTTQLKGNRIHHGIGYIELIGLVGYEFSF